MVTARFLAAMLIALMVAGCGKAAETPVKTGEQRKTEKDAATKAVRDNPVYGEQFKSLDKAKASAAAVEDAAKKTEDAIKKMDEAK